MTIGSRRASVLLFVGDLIAFAFSLWLTLLLRFGELPSHELLRSHLAPFGFLFLLWTLIFFMSGLYEKQVALVKRDLSGRIARTQVANIVVAALLFFFVPALVITPKTILAIYLVVSLLAVFLWRLILYPRFTLPRSRLNAVMIGTRPEETELARELNGNPRYGLSCSAVDPSAIASGALEESLLGRRDPLTILILDARDPAVAPLLPTLYRHAFESDRFRVVDFLALYEEVFDRVPLSALGYEWFFRNVARQKSGFYYAAKRAIDIAGGILMGVITAVIYPFIAFALRIEGKGPVLIRQDRFGERGIRIRSYKFRSMRFSDSGMWPGEGENRVTRVGEFLRRTSLDEFPQFVNVLRGELSLVGPRNDLLALGERLGDALPYYRVRYLVRPGITGWAQVNQRYEPGNISPQSIEETKLRLAYDFYYLKHRSLMLDITIALKTIKRMFFRVTSF